MLDGISPWWWIAFAIILAALEMLTVSTVLIWSAGAAAIVALALALWPALTTPLQIALFAVLSIALTFAGRAVVARWGDGAAPARGLNRRADQLVGREATVESFAGAEGQVTVDGIPWPARLEDGSPIPGRGDRVRIVATDGIVVRIVPL